ncbi:addiction module component, family protein [Sphingobacteriales bacterium CHB3]|nr:addiction module component, family protein [Sphingobacteriales bacterium CHB3]
MSQDLKQLFRAAFDLPEGDRATLAGLLIESLEPAPDPDIAEAWEREAGRRWAEIESGQLRTIPWEEVRKKLFDRA